MWITCSDLSVSHQEVILDGTMTEYKLTGLLPMSRYIVLVQGEREGRYTSIVTTEFITGMFFFFKKKHLLLNYRYFKDFSCFLFVLQEKCVSLSLLIAPRSC